MLLLLILEVPGRTGTVIPSEALDVVGVGANVDVGANAGKRMEGKIMARKTVDNQPTAMLATALNEAT